MWREMCERNWLCYVRRRNRAFPLCSRVLRNTSSSSSKTASNGSCRANLSNPSFSLSLSFLTSLLLLQSALHCIHHLFTYAIEIDKCGLKLRGNVSNQFVSIFYLNEIERKKIARFFRLLKMIIAFISENLSVIDILKMWIRDLFGLGLCAFRRFWHLHFLDVNCIQY